MKKLTERQVAALVAAYHGQRPSDEAVDVYGPSHPQAGQPYWRARTRMGGAVQRMVENLQLEGYLTKGRYRNAEAWHDEYSNQLTAKAFAALETAKPVVIKDYRGDVIYTFDLDRAKLAELKAAREAVEAEQAKALAAHRATAADRRAAIEAKERTKRLAKLRELFNAEAIGGNWSDDKLLAFADSVREAHH